MGRSERDTDRLLDAAKRNKGVRSWADLARLLDETDQSLTNWKARGIPKEKLMTVGEKVGANPYWIRDGGDLPQEIVYQVSKPVADMARVAEKLPEEYIRHETSQLTAIAELINGQGKSASPTETVPKKEGNGW